MNPLQMWIGSALAHSLWQGAVVGAVLAIALAFARGSRAQVRYGLACAAMLTMFVAFAVTLIMTRPESSAHVKVLIPPPAFARVGAAIAVGEAPAEPLLTRLAGWAVPVWMVGVAALLLYRFAGWIAAQRLRRMGIRAVPEEWSERFEAMLARLEISRSVALVESYLAQVPMVIGYLRPVVLVPVGMLAGLPLNQVEAILLHELAHIRRADYLVNLLQTVVESMLFYHPAAWWISSVIRTEREHCCDDFVLARDTDPRTYAAALIALEQGRSTGVALALGANDGNLVRRVRRMLQTPVRESSVAIGPLVLAMMAAGVAVSALIAQAPPKVVKPAVVAQNSAAPISAPPLMIAQQPVVIAQAQQPRLPQAPPVLTTDDPYARWIGDVRYIITDAERNAWTDLKTDDEREQFIKQFWARRDPTPGTDVNEYRDEHYRRIAYANAHFGYPSHSGSFSDRGRIYIIYGPADEIESHPRGGSYQRPAEQGGGTTSTYPFENWRYRYIEGLGSNIIVEFIDNAGNGEYRMAMDPLQALALQPSSLPETLAGQPLRVVQGVASRRSDQLREQLARWSARYSDSHPDVMNLRLQLDQAIREEDASGANGAIATSGSRELEIRRDEQSIKFFEAVLAAQRTRRAEADPEVVAAKENLERAIKKRSADGTPGPPSPHSGVLIYSAGRVTLVIPLVGAGPFHVSGRVMTSDGKPVMYFEENANPSLVNLVREVVLKPGSYVFNATRNGDFETATFDVK